MTKPFAIPKVLVWNAFQRVKANRGNAGVVDVPKVGGHRPGTLR